MTTSVKLLDLWHFWHIWPLADESNIIQLSVQAVWVYCYPDSCVLASYFTIILFFFLQWSLCPLVSSVSRPVSVMCSLVTFVSFVQIVLYQVCGVTCVATGHNTELGARNVSWKYLSVYNKVLITYQLSDWREHSLTEQTKLKKLSKLFIFTLSSRSS